ncbi:hypothetical protein GCM10010156_75920 [Planobispora rosea]|uniref:DUF2530 domain-containing protein n=1 Tax=Planobispora rosea TaxID=35762 RepID=Q2MLS0_PLARO|nr:hypothetical protein [Planobispora rosea]ABC59131.1 hypothetical protein pPR2.18 [Planobispora rosea]GGT07503.1 hypothetical protein GCM10010156_75920 [Planobispora rosea]GIH89337.1 hypothetical protein Pro02_77450 [Planobispora rosea]
MQPKAVLERLRAAIVADPDGIYRAASVLCVASAVVAMVLLHIYGRTWLAVPSTLGALAGAVLIHLSARERNRRDDQE